MAKISPRALAIAAAIAFAAPVALEAASYVNSIVGVCDPANPGNCLAPNSSGQMPVTGTVTATNPAVGLTGAAVPTSASLDGFNKSGNLTAALLDASSYLDVDIQAWNAGTLTISGTVTANAGTNLNTSALALDTSVNGLLLSQGSTTSGQKGPLIEGAVTTSAPSYTTAQTSPLSLDTSGNLRMICMSGCSGTSSTFGAAFPSTGLAIGAKNGANMVNLAADASNNLDVNLQTAIPTGANVIGAVTQSAGPWTENQTQINGSAIITGAAGVQAVSIRGNANGIFDFAGQNAASPANEIAIGCQFNTSPTTVTSGNATFVQCDNGGRTLVDIGTALPTGANTIGAVTQASGPWTENLTQIAGSAIVTGAAGVQAVAVRGNANAVADNAMTTSGPATNAFSTKIGDGLGNARAASVDASNELVTELSVGGTLATIKTSGTNAATTDTAVVVAPSPNPSTVCGSKVAINQTTSTDVYTTVAKMHICEITLISATQQQVSIVEGTGTTCATGTAALWGATTADATHGMPFAANGGMSPASERAFAVTQTTADHVCILQSGAGLLSGAIWFTDHN